MPIIQQRVTIFGTDDVTPVTDYAGASYGTVGPTGAVTVATFSTDPAEARPYLKVIDNLAPSEVNFREGSGVIGQVNFVVLDKRTVVADQTTGVVTRLLADVGGIPQLLGHRCLVQQGPLTAPILLLDGIITSITEDDSLATFTFILKDVRERERRSRFFVASDTTSVFPAGSAVSWGKVRQMFAVRSLIEPVVPWKGTFRANHLNPILAGYAGLIMIDAPVPPDGSSLLTQLGYWQKWTAARVDAWRKVGWPTRGYGKTLDHRVMRYHDIALQWRPEGSGGAWTQLVDMPWYDDASLKIPAPNAFVRKVTTVLSFSTGIYDVEGELIGVVASSASATGLPADGQRVEFRVLSRGAPSEEAPLLIDMNRGVLLQKLYDGEYGPVAPPPATNPRSNLIVRSNDWSASWTLQAMTQTPNAAIAPDGTLTATKIVNTNVTGVHQTFQSYVRAAAPGQFTSSIYVKNAGVNVFTLLVTNGNTGASARATLDLTTGAVSNVGGVGFNNVGYKVRRRRNGWFRFSVTGNLTDLSVANLTIQFYANPVVSGPGDGVNGVYVWKAQFEAGAKATRAILTTTTIVTLNDARPTGWVPPIRYDDDAMADFQSVAGNALMPIMAVEKDMRKWTQEHIYKPEGWAPWVNDEGEVEPIASYLPDANETLVQLDNSNVSVDGTGWRLDDASVINAVEFTYRRWYLAKVDAAASPLSGLKNVEEIVRWENATSSLLMGEKLLSFAPVTVGECTLDPTGASTRGASNEGGSKLAEYRAIDAMDRLTEGAGVLIVRARRSDTGVASLRAGRWSVVALSWVPDYLTHKRGINRLMQVTSVHDLDPAWREITLEDAGPYGQPIAQPTIGNLVAQTDRRVSVDLTAMPVGGGEVQIDYAVSPTQPTTSSGLWLPLVRATALGTYYTPPQGSRATVWVRAYGAQAGRRSSATTTPLSITLSLVPTVVGVTLSVNADGAPVVLWTPLDDTLGMRIAYATHAAGTAPLAVAALTTLLHVDASLGVAVLPFTLAQEQQVSLTATPYSAFSGGVTSGTAGLASPVLTALRRDVQFPVMPEAQELRREDTTSGYLALTVNDPQKRVTGWEYRTQVGNTAPGAWTAWANPAVETSVLFMDKQPSKIEYRALGWDGYGVSGKYLVSKSVPFSLGARPLPPTVGAYLDDAGTLTGTVDGDSDTVNVKLAASLTGVPSDAVVRATALVATVSRSAAVASLLTGVRPGQRYFLKAFAYGSTGLESNPTEYNDVWVGTSSTPQPDPVITAAPSSDKIAYTVTFDRETVRLDVYFLEHSVAPAAGNLYGLAPLVVRIEIEPTDNARTRTFSLPLAYGANYHQVTAIPNDILGRKGSAINLITQGVPGAAPPLAPTVGAATITGTTVSHPITWPGVTPAAGWRVRPYVDNIAQADTVLSAGNISAATVTIVHSGFAPATAHAFQYSLVDANGYEGARSAVVNRTTSTIVLDAPTILVERPGGPTANSVRITITPGANNPVGGTTYVISRTTPSPATYTTSGTSYVDGSIAAGLRTYTAKASVPGSGYTDSVASNTGSA